MHILCFLFSYLFLPLLSVSAPSLFSTLNILFKTYRSGIFFLFWNYIVLNIKLYEPYLEFSNYSSPENCNCCGTIFHYRTYYYRKRTLMFVEIKRLKSLFLEQQPICLWAITYLWGLRTKFLIVLGLLYFSIQIRIGLIVLYYSALTLT